MLKGLIFDFDGTLADTIPLCYAAFRGAAEPLIGRPITDEYIRSTFGPSEEGAVKTLAPNAPAQCLENYVRLYEELHDIAPAPFEGILELLARMKNQRIKLGIVTGKGPRTLAVSLKLYEMEDLFDAVRAGCEHGPCKPANVREILTEWRMSPGEAAYVGDVPQDVRDARVVGCQAVAACWAPGSQKEAMKAAEPDVLCETLDEFERWTQNAMHP